MNSRHFSSLSVSRRDVLRSLAFAAGTAALGGARVFAQATQPPPITTAPLAGKLSLVSGAGGNIALLAGEDGSLVVDSGLADLATGTAAEIAKAGPLAMLVNTHWHFDHAGGNERLARAGARIVASENCRARLSAEQRIGSLEKVLVGMPAVFPPAPPIARPTVTFTQETTLHLNGERIRLIPVAPAHTDGDVLVRFETANVLHMGDTFFHGFYPFIDYTSGGWIGGMVAATKVALTLTDSATRIIPGHGPVATQEELKGYITFLEMAHERLGGG